MSKYLVRNKPEQYRFTMKSTYQFAAICESLNMAPLSSDNSYLPDFELVCQGGQRGSMNPRYGTKHSAESVAKMSASAKKRWIEAPRRGFNHSDETKKLLSDKAKGRRSPRIGIEPWNKGIPQSEAVKEAISKALSGKPRSEAARKSLAEGARRRIKMQCAHCGMIADASNIGRWHNDNCREKAVK